MSDSVELAARAIVIGVGATAAMDLWAQFLKRAFGSQPLNWGLFGRWLAHLPRGYFIHGSIAKASPVTGETAIGWTAHYVIGILLAGALLVLQGLEWARHPTPIPALAFGMVTVVFPFFVMQPGMGAGVASSKTLNPGRARLRSLLTHTVFGIGLYVSALLSALLWQ
jgi:hypothetical protein